jgi:hypothetical protein
MNTTSASTAALRCALENPNRGIVGVVDDLLTLCQEHGLHLEWQDDRCRIHCPADGSDEVINSPVGKSIFRAILARLAALCNEHRPNSVSPYGGQGEVTVGHDPGKLLHVSFVNTPEAQRLKLGIALPDSDALDLQRPEPRSIAK